MPEHSFVSQAALRGDIGTELGLTKRLATVQDCRHEKKGYAVHYGYLPVMAMDPQTYALRDGGLLLSCEPATVLPMAQRYFLS